MVVPCATYDGEAGRLRDPETGATVGCISSQGILLVPPVCRAVVSHGRQAVVPEEREATVNDREAKAPADATAPDEKTEKGGAAGTEVWGNFETSDSGRLAENEGAGTLSREHIIASEVNLEDDPPNNQAFQTWV
jgi:hypothetical protein